MTTRKDDKQPAPTVLELFQERRAAQDAGESGRAYELQRRMAETPARCIGEVAIKLQVAAQRSPVPLITGAHGDLFRLDPDQPIPAGKSHPKHHMTAEDPAILPWPDGPGLADAPGLSERLLAALQGLPLTTRDAFILHTLEVWTSSRIAYHLEVSEADVTKHIHRAIYALDKARMAH